MLNCPCCYSSFFWVAIVSLIFVIQLTNVILKNIFAFLKLQDVYKWISRFFLLITSLLVAGIAVLASSSSLQSLAFAKLSDTLLLKDQPLDLHRCELLKEVHGRVLEIGPGPGVNFRCWGNSNQITEWVGVEPNTNFKDQLAAEKTKRNVTFPTRTVWLKGEDYNVEPDTFDYVVGTHILCSIDDIPGVIQQIRRALKPNGSYLFLEHVKAAPDTTNYYLQQIFEPLMTLIGNGCRFKETWNDLSEHTLLKGYHVELNHQMLPVGIPFLSPHIVGKAMKRN
jgi:ubiquinone/menaquinone biosynthesis C-methylase UbiE